MGQADVMGLARKMAGTAGREATLRAMDRDELRRVMGSLGVVKLHYFGDGRKVFIKQSSEFERPRYNIGVQNVTTEFAWAEDLPYYDLDKAVSTAEQLFGIKDWNAV